MIPCNSATVQANIYSAQVTIKYIPLFKTKDFLYWKKIILIDEGNIMQISLTGQSSEESVSLPPEYGLQLEPYLFKYSAILFSIKLFAV